MSLTWNLFVAHARHQKVRLALTALAMIAAVGVVLWVVSAYEMIASRFDNQTEEFVGNFDLFVVPQRLDEGLATELVTSIDEHPSVDFLNAAAQFRMWFRRVGKPPEDAPPRERGLGVLGPTVVGTQLTEPRYPLTDGRWLNLQGSETVVSSGVAEALSLKPGDEIEFKTRSGETIKLPVVGIVEQVDDVEFAMTRTKGGAPGGFNRGPASLAAYVSMHDAERLAGATPRLNLLEIRLKPGTKSADLEKALAAATPAAELLRPEDVKAKIAAGFQADGARKQAYFVTALSILASAFIIFTTLSMGVNERARQLAVLRAVGLQRTQVAALVVVEAITLAVVGWLGGLAGGWILLQVLVATRPQMFPNGVGLGMMSVVLTGACSLLGALLASVFPIWKATRISPLEAMAPLPTTPRSPRWYAMAAIISLALVAVNPLLVYLPSLAEEVRFLLVMALGVPTTAIGFVLMAPLAVLIIERILGPIVSWCLRLQYGLVRTQLSNNMWRSAGIAASLMLGLGLFTATQVWGWSMLGGFLPGRWAPNTIVKLSPGIAEDIVDKVLRLEGIETASSFPIAVEQTKLAGDPLRSGERDSAVRQDNVALIGIDATAAFAGNDPAFQLDFVQGNRDEALAKLGEGRFCLVPQSFLQYANLGVGDKIGLIPPKSPSQPIEYTIAGVVAMPGSNWMTKTTGLRRHSVRTAGIVFAPREQVRGDFDLKMVEYFWVNMKVGVTPEQLEEQIAPLVTSASPEGRPRRGDGPPAAKGRRGGGEEPSASSKGEGKKKGEGGLGGRRRGGGGGGFNNTFATNQPVKVTSLDEVRDGMRQRGGAAVQAMGWLPLITLLVVSLGVVNTIAASVRARRWEFGILRSVGVTRWGLMRLVISEAILVAFVASLLSLAFGVLTGWTCLGLVRYVSNPWFEGVATPFTIPWPSLAFGYAIAFALCFVAALWPAIAAGRAEPLSLLQGGRAST